MGSLPKLLAQGRPRDRGAWNAIFRWLMPYAKLKAKDRQELEDGRQDVLDGLAVGVRRRSRRHRLLLQLLVDIDEALDERYNPDAVRGRGAILQEGHWPPQQARSHCSRECEREPEPELGPRGTRGEAVGPAQDGPSNPNYQITTTNQLDLHFLHPLAFPQQNPHNWAATSGGSPIG